MSDKKEVGMTSPWECPRCHKINAPSTPQCFCNPTNVRRSPQDPIYNYMNGKAMAATLYNCSLCKQPMYNNGLEHNCNFSCT